MSLVPFKDANVGVFSFDSTTTKPLPHYEFDLSVFRDPMNRKEFKECKNGSDFKILTWIREDVRFKALLNECITLAHDARENQGKRWITLCFRDHHGRWKSRAVATLIAMELSILGHSVCLSHLEKGEIVT